MKRISILFTTLFALVLTLAACGSSGSSAAKTSPSSPPTTGNATSASTNVATAPGTITVGSADFPESELLGFIYADAMKAKGVTVTVRPNIGERPIYMQALNDGSIGFVPEYSGSILGYLDPTATAKSAADVYSALQTAAAAKNLVPLQYAAAQDSDTITVTKATATKYHLTSIADLKAVASKLTFGAPAQFKTRADGIPALKSVYGVTFGTFTPLQAGGTITVTALKNGSIDAADIFSTDSSIAQNGLVSLTDPKNMFAAQNIVPLAAKSKLTEPMTQACNAVSAKLDTKTLAGLVAKINPSTSAESVAKQWLSSVGLG